MRYFLSTAAAKPVSAGGYEFAFELVGLRGGSWLGVLAESDDARGAALAAARTPNVDEIDEATYDSQKKKSSANPPNSPAWPNQRPNPPALAVAERAGSLTYHEGSSQNGAAIADPRTGLLRPQDIPNGGPNSTSGFSAVALMMTDKSPPAEPLLAVAGERRRRDA